MTTVSRTLPSGVSAPLTTNNDNDHSGLIVVIAAFYLVLVLSALLGRVYSSYHRHIIQTDDYLFGVLVIAASAQASVVLAQVHYGWGTRAESVRATDNRMLKAGYAADILSILVLGFSKITTCVFYDTLFSHMQRRFIRMILGGMIIWTLLAIILLAIRCSHDPWYDISAAQCDSLLPRWQAITAIDIITEVLVLLYSGLAIHKVRISIKKKVIVFLALESRILLVPLAALRFHYTTLQIASNDPALIGAFATVTTEIYLALSVSCLVTAFLKSFVAAYEDKYGVSYTEGVYGTRSQLTKPDSTYTTSQRNRSYTSTNVDRLRGWEREEDPIIHPADADQGLHVMRTVQYRVRDEYIELTDRGTASS
ncbi:hypothetical protein N7474_005112 [Penicillium riverlandense]|uniref:uncharacterized protein n=1 Tax=Penicillium riverlandense TaxID=1903569 RepID=UPI002548D8F2|nr:uncharacterized protein N7474_005112 [Penicillium riverlandense]KAJ5819521.1 hypothetical protein N7474_005112 [Penicillium riverlandense]